MWKGFFDIREYMGKNFNFKQISNSYVIEEGRDKLRKAAVRSKYP